MLTVGMDAYADPAGRSNARSPFDSNIVSDFDRMETILDYIFLTMGIDGTSVDHPIVMTEAPCNPSYSRKLSMPIAAQPRMAWSSRPVTPRRMSSL
ncbi:uncharacterized protein BYT42DRAFT_205879 [Radiomyces spectabilis]|uniref:uncharacterized protein n=1 Tax=Radiomyces spectabilis TaxID=64574 RepID=UPI00221FE704|nr:uncharacterized protein BYT42DRAFT_205879 [Radiomyces spectabilis]KAI8391728.1 hypothetical protein BYT42DRAFT_205879 [Radiomyces spectabilis]